MNETNEALKVWQALKPMIGREIEAKTRSCVRATKMRVTVPPPEPEPETPETTEETQSSSPVSDNPTSETSGDTEETGEETGEEERIILDGQIPIGVAENYNGTISIPSGREFSNIETGDAVWVYWYMNNASTMHVALNGDGTPGTGSLNKLLTEIAASKSALTAYITNVAGDIRTEIAYGDSALYSYITISSSELRSEFGDAINNVYSSITQTASMIRAEVHTGQSALYSYIEMTASYIRSEVGNTISGLYSSIEQTASHIRADVWAAESSLYSYIEITASNIKSEVGSVESGLYSSIEQTASSIRADVWAAESNVYSYMEMTASYIRTEVGDSLSGMYSSIQQTASEIRADVWASESDLYAYIDITASSIRSEVGDVESGLYSAISQTATEIRADVWASESSIYSYIQLTASGIRSEVGSSESDIYTAIAQNAYNISLKVSAGDVATQLAVEVGNVTITGGNLIVDGMITSTSLATAIASLGEVDVDGILYCTGAATFSEDVTFLDSVIGPGAQFTTLYFGQGGANDAGDAVSGFGTPTESGGQISIPYNTFNQTGAGTINFNIAATQTYIDGVAAAEAGVTVSLIRTNRGYDSANNRYFISVRADASNGDYEANTFYVSAPTLDSQTAGIATYSAANNEYTIPVTALLSNGYSDSDSITIDASDAYNAGASSVPSVTLSGSWTGYQGSGKKYTVTASNGATQSSPRVNNLFMSGNPTWAADNKSFTQLIALKDEDDTDIYSKTFTFDATDAYNAGASSVTVTGASGWISGANTLTLSNGLTYTTYMPASATWTGDYNLLGGYTVTCTAGGKTYTHVFNI